MKPQYNPLATNYYREQVIEVMFQYYIGKIPDMCGAKCDVYDKTKELFPGQHFPPYITDGMLKSALHRAIKEGSEYACQIAKRNKFNELIPNK